MKNYLLAAVAALIFSFSIVSSSNRSIHPDYLNQSCKEANGSDWEWRSVVAGQDICINKNTQQVRYL